LMKKDRESLLEGRYRRFRQFGSTGAHAGAVLAGTATKDGDR
jgi:hypothetical protein